MIEHHAAIPDAVDVAVIGAGPAGSSAAAMLARSGRSVLVLERQRFPRFHIGESMLPYTMTLLDRMSLLGRVKAQGYPLKKGAEFIFPTGDFRRIDFADQGAGRYPDTIQVERGHFDSVLLDHARNSGAIVVEDAQVTGVVMDGSRVAGLRYVAGERPREVRARYVVDAGGRSSKLSQVFRLRRNIERLRMVAVYRHFTGLDERYNPTHEGDIQIGGHEDGWIWAIPIWSDTISVGAVMPKAVLQAGTPEQVFAEHLDRIPRITARLTGTTPKGELRIEADYCYYTDTLAGPGWFLVGDAGSFTDPIFSAGVFLAIVTGTTAAGAIDQLLDEPHREAELQDEYGRYYKTGYDTYTRLIFAYYESRYNLGRYLRSLGVDVESRYFVRLLAGDFWSRHNPIGELLRSTRQWDTFAPFERIHRCPVYAELDEAEHMVAAGSVG